MNCVYDYPGTRIDPDLRSLVKIPTWNYAKLDCTSARLGVGVHFVPSCVGSPPVATTKPMQKISWFHDHIDVAKTYICNSVRPGTKRNYHTGEQRWLVVADQIGTDSLMRIVPDVWARRTDSMRDSSLTWPEACMSARLFHRKQPLSICQRSVNIFKLTAWMLPF